MSANCGIGPENTRGVWGCNLLVVHVLLPGCISVGIPPKDQIEGQYQQGKEIVNFGKFQHVKGEF